jgi:hypothetical protein
MKSLLHFLFIPLFLITSLGLISGQSNNPISISTDDLGSSVSIDGNFAISGAHDGLVNGVDIGIAIIYQYDSVTSTWVEATKLFLSDGLSTDEFGGSVSISGETAIVSAYRYTINGIRSGAAFIYQKDFECQGKWGLVKKLVPFDNVTFFGRSVSIYNDYAIVGATEEADDDIGSVYIFKRDSGGSNNWGLVKKLLASDASIGDRFGHSVSISGNVLISSSLLDDDNGNNSGSAYIFGKDVGGVDNWGEIKKLVAHDGSFLDWFGRSVSVSNNTVVIGANGVDNNGTDQGAAYIYSKDQGGIDNWGLNKKLTANDAEDSDRFGYSVSIDEDNISIGAYLTDELGSGSGSAYIYQKDEGGLDNWGMVKKIIPTSNGNFGFSVSVNDDRCISGARTDDDGGVNLGASYIFSKNLGGQNNWGQVTKLVGGLSTFVEELCGPNDCQEFIILNNQTIPDDTYQSSQTIESNGLVDTLTTVTFRSNEIYLNPGFEVFKPSTFEAIIDPCTCVLTLDCPANIVTVNTDNGECFWTADNTFPVTASSTCLSSSEFQVSGASSIQNGIGEDIQGTLFNLGQNNFSFTISNDLGMSESCSFIIEVQDSNIPSIKCVQNYAIPVNANCIAAIPDFSNDVTILNSCTSIISLNDISQTPNAGTIISGISELDIFMSATSSDGSIYTCQSHLSIFDDAPPVVMCSANGTISIPIDSNCQTIIPDMRTALDNCDVLIPSNGDGPGPRVYQVPSQGVLWDGFSDLLVIAVDGSGLRDTCENIVNTTCPSINNAPYFTQFFSDLSAQADANCEFMISVPFQIDYCIPDNLSVGFSVSGPNAADANLSINASVTNGSVSDYILSGTMPIGSHTISVNAFDSNCGLSTIESFDVVVIPPGSPPPTFQCKKIVKTIGNAGSVSFTSDEIVCVSNGSSCDPFAPSIISSFSSDPTDTVRSYDCTNIGDIQVTMFIFNVFDSNNNGVLDTIFSEPCFAIQTVIDQNNICSAMGN